jgi:4-carboxymuconolactone decarboxylase
LQAAASPGPHRVEFQGDLFDQGKTIRSRVVGEDYVSRALGSVDDFSAPLQKLVTEAAWGMVWTRDGLGLRERSMITVAMLAALGKTEELRTHLRGARNNGVTVVELREMLLQVCIYAGFPAGIAAFREAQIVLREG